MPKPLEWKEFIDVDDLNWGLNYVYGYYNSDPEFVFTTLLYVETDGSVWNIDKEFNESTDVNDITITHCAEFGDMPTPEEYNDAYLLDVLKEDIEEFVMTVKISDDLAEMKDQLSTAIDFLDNVLAH